MPSPFLTDRPGDLRNPGPWHRLSHIVRVLPERLEALSAGLAVVPGETVLDYGCAEIPYRRFFPAEVDYIAADLPGNERATTEIGPDGRLPLADASVDAVLSTQVLEHVEDPGLYLAECRRVLRPGGRMLLSTHGIMVWHPDPVDYWRWTSDGLRRTIAGAGLEVEHLEGVMGLEATGRQLVQDSLYWRVPRVLAAPLALVLQSLAKLADRLEPQASKDMNAMVFAVVARKP